MATLYSSELFTGRGGKDSIDRELKHTRVFEVRTDDPNDDENVVALEPGLPRIGEFHPRSPSAIMREISAYNTSDDPTLWLVTCEYDNAIPKDQAKEVAGPNDDGASVEKADGATERADNPLDRPAKYKIDWEQSTEPCTEWLFDWDGAGDIPVPITNSFGDPFDPPPMHEVAKAVISIEKNFPVGAAILDFAVQEQYQNAVNDRPWHGLSTGTVRITKIGVEYDYENGVAFGKVTFQGKVDRKGHDQRIADMGFNEVDGGGQKRRIDVPRGSGVFPNEPQPLNGAGQALGVGVPLVFLEFKTRVRKNFAAIGI